MPIEPIEFLLLCISIYQMDFNDSQKIAYICVIHVNQLLTMSICFYFQSQEMMPRFWFSCDCLTDIVFVLDIIVQLRTGYLEQGLMVSRKYLMSFSVTEFLLVFVVGIFGHLNYQMCRIYGKSYLTFEFFSLDSYSSPINNKHLKHKKFERSA